MKKRGIALAAMFAAASLAFSACTAPSAPTTTGSSTAATGSSSGSGDELSKIGNVIKPKDGKSYKIGVSFADLDQFLQTVKDGMDSRAKEAGVELNVVSAQQKADIQLNQVQNFISAKVDAIIVVPVDTDATGPITAAATGAKIPLVYVNRMPKDLPEGVPYIGSDSLKAGTLEMEALAKLVNNKGNVAILQGPPENEASVMRTKGCKDVAEKVGMKVVREATAQWARDKALAVVENWIQSGDKIDVICSNNDDMALGAIQALKNANKLKEVKVGGVDATPDALNAMAAGELSVTVFQDAAGQGKGGVDAAIQLANGGKVSKYIDIPFQPVTPENMSQFKK